MTEFKKGDRVVGLAAYPNHDSELIEGVVDQYNFGGASILLSIGPDKNNLMHYRSIITRTAKRVEEPEATTATVRAPGVESEYEAGYLDAVADYDRAGKKPAPESARAAVLTEASQLITGDRNKSYGSPTQNFTNTAEVWTALLRHKLRDGERITATEVGTLMVGLKLARTVAQPKRDNFVDISGYAACAWQTIADQEDGEE